MCDAPRGGMRLVLAIFLVLALAPGTAAGEPSRRVPATDNGDWHPPDHGWWRLASPTPTRWGTEYINVPEDTWLRMLRIQRANGTVVVRELRVITLGKNGRTRVINVDARLDRWKTDTYIDLGYSVRVDQIAITCDRRSAGSYVVYASAAETHEDVALR